MWPKSCRDPRGLVCLTRPSSDIKDEQHLVWLLRGAESSRAVVLLTHRLFASTAPPNPNAYPLKLFSGLAYNILFVCTLTLQHFYMYLSVHLMCWVFCLCVSLWVAVSVEVRRGVSSSGPGHHVSDANQIQVLSRRSKGSYPRNQLSNSTTIIFKTWRKIVFLAVRNFIFFFPQLWTPHLSSTMNFIQ